MLAGALGGLAAACSPPSLLSGLDRVSGGGAGARRVASAMAFGTHGQRLDIYAPAGGGGGPRPVVVFFYGGSWQSGTRGGYAFAGRALAAQGFVAVVPDYRKVPAVRFPAFVEDGAEAVRWVAGRIGEMGGDPGRIALAGHSAGAHLAILLALDRSWGAADVVRAGVGLSGPYDFLPFTGAAVAAFAGVDDPRRTQPIAFARADAPPLLLATSDEDTLVKPRNAVALAERLRALGAPVTLKTYPGLSHAGVVMALSRPFRGKAPVLADLSAFLHAAMPAARVARR